MSNPAKRARLDLGENPDSGLPLSPHTPTGSVSAQPMRDIGGPIPFPLDLSQDSGAGSMPASPRTPVQPHRLEVSSHLEQQRSEAARQYGSDRREANGIFHLLHRQLDQQPNSIVNTPQNRPRLRVLIATLQRFARRTSIRPAVVSLVRERLMISGGERPNVVTPARIVMDRIMTAPSPRQEYNRRAVIMAARAFNDRSRFYRCSEGGRPGPR
jgi:hypothetical protein